VAQNVYDDEAFFSGYSTLPRSVHGHGAPEWLTLGLMLTDLEGRRALDLACGFGWFSRWAADNGAGGVVGIDLSERMLEKARGPDRELGRYLLRQDLDAFELEAAGFDSPTVRSPCTTSKTTRPSFVRFMQRCGVGGVFVFSVEHPVHRAHESKGSSRRLTVRSRGRSTTT
jgi:SAM-dependent methyltransferase